MRKITLFNLTLGWLLMAVSWPAHAAENLQLHKISNQVYAIIGPLGNRNTENLGNNASFGFVVTNEGVVLVDPGGSYRGAEAIHTLIKQVTDKPVKRVINTGGQDHRWLGNGYFKQQGARIIASRDAVADQHARFSEQYSALDTMMGKDALAGTEAVYADEVFDQALGFDFGGVRFEVQHPSRAHTPGDSFVWLPQQRVLFGGDIVYIDRMLVVGAQSNSRDWLTAFDALAALKPEVLVPGHGPVTTLKNAQRDTRDYLVFLRQAVGEFIDNGGGIENIGSIDQSRFKHLANFDELKGRNAQQVFQELEWE